MGKKKNNNVTVEGPVDLTGATVVAGTVNNVKGDQRGGKPKSGGGTTRVTNGFVFLGPVNDEGAEYIDGDVTR